MQNFRFCLSAILMTVALAGSGCSLPSGKQNSLFDTAAVRDALAQPPAERDWQDYQTLSDRIGAVDEAVIKAELRALGLHEPVAPPHGVRFGFDPDQPVSFYKTAEGRRIANILLSFQTPSGGWSKRTDMSVHRRQPGEAFGFEQSYIPTFDNHATSTQLWVLTKAWQATGDSRYSDAVVRGIKLILLAQYPNGGWPQNFPLTGGYHDDITYNDAVTTNLLEIVQAVSTGGKGMGFVPENLRRRASKSYAAALESVIATQVVVKGTPTIWGAQHDPHTLLPTAARTFEPIALATSESAELLLILMQIEKPSNALKNAITAAAAWFQDNRIFGYEWASTVEGESRLQAKDGAEPLWPRFAELSTNRPIFGDRDGRVYYDVNEISQERHTGYAWYTHAPAKVLRAYPKWHARHF